MLQEIEIISKEMEALKKRLKLDYMSGNVVRNGSNPKKLWESINLALYRGNKGKKRKIDCIEHNGLIQTESSVIATVFNDYFCSIGNVMIGNRCPDIPKLASSEVYRNYKEQVRKVHTFEQVTPEDIRTIINCKIKSGKAPGMDGITTNIVKSLVNCNSFVDLFVRISNNMLESGTFPILAKEAIVVPIFKKGSRKLVENYRPVSLLNAFSKILEYVLKDRLLRHLNDNHILHVEQYVFIEKSDTTSAVMDLVSELNDEIDKGKMIAGIFLDLSKAFDLMDHEILIKKLQMYGLEDKALNVFSDYLTSRSQRVRINGTLSEPLPIVRGVPQGSVIGPLLFVIYINDMFDLHLHGKIRCYADDTSYFSSSTDIDFLTMNANVDIRLICVYMRDNLLMVDASKTQLIVFRSHMRYTDLNFRNQFEFDGSYLTPESSVKYLGMILDCHLKWKHHTEHISRKISPIIGLIYKLRVSLNKEALLALYYGLINSHLSYMCPIWASGYASNMCNLNVLQKKAIKFIFGLDRIHPSNDLFTSYPIKSIEYLHRYSTILFIHKNINGQVHSNMNFELVDHAHDTRQRPHLLTERFNTNWGRFDVRYNGVRMYNNIPEVIRAVPSISLFKKRMKQHLNSIA